MDSDVMQLLALQFYTILLGVCLYAFWLGYKLVRG